MENFTLLSLAHQRTLEQALAEYVKTPDQNAAAKALRAVRVLKATDYLETRNLIRKARAHG